MTDRLYYDDPYLVKFTARVLEIADGRARLDRSAFYPTSGGQPFDTGAIGAARVTDVESVEGEVWHAFEGELLEGAEYECEIDWPRRFDHMQQHAGEHMIANAVWRLFAGYTIGLHIGADFSTIDADLPGGRTRLEPEEIDRIERDVNENIWRNLPIRCYFTGEPDSLPLRKRGNVLEHVRIVDIGGYELVPCGGTHPSRTGDIGLVKIIDSRPSRGKMRLAFVCGGRAALDYKRRYDLLEEAANALSTSVENVPGHVAALMERAKDAEYRLARANEQALAAGAEKMLQGAETIGGARIVATEAEADMDGLRALAARLIELGADCALVEGRGKLAFMRGQAFARDMGALMRAVAKGGGKPDFAQGSGAGGAARALEELRRGYN